MMIISIGVYFSRKIYFIYFDVCYLPNPDKKAHPDCWILSKLTNNDESLTQNNCGFISFACELHHEIQEDEFKQNNYRNSFQSSIEKIYSKILENNFPVDDLKSDSLMKSKSKNAKRKDENILSFTDAAQDIMDTGFMVPNLPISISLCADKNFQIHDETRMHAVQITSSSIDKVFTGAYEIIFPNTNPILTSTNPSSCDTSES